MLLLLLLLLLVVLLLLLLLPLPLPLLLRCAWCRVPRAMATPGSRSASQRRGFLARHAGYCHALPCLPMHSRAFPGIAWLVLG
ncbi:MAG: hypothetical protein RSF79_30085 [Janthinobacterium sp.]